MPKKKDSELHRWLTGQWGKRLTTNSLDRKPDRANHKLQISRQSQEDWIDEMEELDAILEDD